MRVERFFQAAEAIEAATDIEDVRMAQERRSLSRMAVASEMIGQRAAFARAFGAGQAAHEYEPGGRSRPRKSARRGAGWPCACAYPPPNRSRRPPKP